jgi:hypothetical protein
MPTFPEHYLLQWGGDFVSESDEIWSNGLRMRHNDQVDLSTFPDYDSDKQDALVAQYKAKVATFVGSGLGGYSANVRLQYVKFNRIGTNGRYVDQNKTHVSFVAGEGQVGTGEGKHAVTHSTCVTFLTADARGRGSKGRLFVPHSNLGVTAPDYRYPQNAALNMAQAWRQFIADLRDLPGVTAPNVLVPYVMSSIAPGSAKRIERVQVGNFPDYMGSRRNRLTEVRSTAQALY